MKSRVESRPLPIIAKTAFKQPVGILDLGILRMNFGLVTEILRGPYPRDGGLDGAEIWGGFGAVE